MGRGEKLNKEKDSHFNDNDIIKSENSFESAFSDKGPEFESAFQEEKAEKRYVLLTFVKNKEGQYVYDGGTATYPPDGVTVVDNYSSDWTKEQLNRLRTKDQEIFGPATPLSEVVREHPQADSAQRRISLHSSGAMHKTVDLDYTDQNSSIEKAKFLRLSFEYNEEKKDYYLSYNSASRYSW